jgi:hypothetical protein
MNIAQLRDRAKNDETQLKMDYLKFAQRLSEIEKELYLSPYATLNEVVLWCVLFIYYEKKLLVMRDISNHETTKRLEHIDSKLIDEHYQTDKRSISIWSDYILALHAIEKRYEERLFQFCYFIDSCVRYIQKYSDDLLAYGFELPEIMRQTRALGTLHWLNVECATRYKKSIETEK